MYDGHVDHISRQQVHGWAIDKERIGQSIDVLIALNGTDVLRVTADNRRPDVAAALGISSECHGFSARIPTALDTTIEHRVEVKFADTGAQIQNGERRFVRLDSYDRAEQLSVTQKLPLSALFVTHLPRSGSTLCMALLDAHPWVVVPRQLPFEVKPATYFARAARLLCEPGDHKSSASPTEFMRNAMHLGFNPFNHLAFDSVFKDPQLRDHFFERSCRATLYAALQSTSVDYYQHLAADQGKLRAVYFAEKCEAQGILYGARASDFALFPDAWELLLVRDPRDILCSSRSYFRQPFGEDLLQNLLNGCETIARIARAERAKTLVIKYEDLVLNRRSAINSIAKFLALDSALWQERGNSDIFSKHATTTSPEESVYRWRRDLSDQQKAICAATFSNFLSEFGYD